MKITSEFFRLRFFVENFDPVLKPELNSRGEIADVKRKSYVFPQDIFELFFYVMHPPTENYA